jgi:hypothetical protein
MHELGEPQFNVLQFPQESKEQVYKPLETHAGIRIPRVGISKNYNHSSPFTSSITGIYSTSGVSVLVKNN